MAKSTFTLSSHHEKVVYAAFGLLFASGLLWLVVHFALAPSGEFPTPHPSERYLMALHGLVAMAFLFIWGTLLPVHMKRAWAQHQHRASGAILNAAIFLQALSSYGLYYFSSEGLLDLARWVHRINGCILPIILAVHLVKAKKRRRRLKT